MPTTQLNPFAEGFHVAWQLGAGASKTAAVQSPDDGDTSYIAESTENDLNSYVMDNLPNSAAAVTTHTLTIRGKRVGAGPGYFAFFRVGGVDGVLTAGLTFTTSYADYTNVDHDLANTNTVSKVNGTEVGVKKRGSSGNTARITTIRWDVTWLAGGGGFAFLLSEWVPPLIGLGSMTLAEIERYLSVLKTRPAYRLELERIKEDLRRAYRVYCFPR